jgi:hypothetical protein
MEEHDTTMSDFDDEQSTQYNLHVATSDIKRHVFLYLDFGQKGNDRAVNAR